MGIGDETKESLHTQKYTDDFGQSWCNCGYDSETPAMQSDRVKENLTSRRFRHNQLSCKHCCGSVKLESHSPMM